MRHNIRIPHIPTITTLTFYGWVQDPRSDVLTFDNWSIDQLAIGTLKYDWFLLSLQKVNDFVSACQSWSIQRPSHRWELDLCILGKGLFWINRVIVEPAIWGVMFWKLELASWSTQPHTMFLAWLFYMLSMLSPIRIDARAICYAGKSLNIAPVLFLEMQL